MLRIPHSDYKVMPWRNGLGVTAEIDRVPGGDEPYLWRFSQASIQTDSAFSIFSGYDRWLAVWQGNEIYLNDVKVAPLEPVRFSGDENTFCRLGGPTVRDVGLIFDRAKVDAKMTLVEGAINLPEGYVHYIFDVESGDTTKIDHAAVLTVERSLLVSVWRKNGGHAWITL